jgi:hypothetical protein
LCSLAGLDPDPIIYTSCIAGITDVRHHTHLFVETGVSLTFYPGASNHEPPDQLMFGILQSWAIGPFSLFCIQVQHRSQLNLHRNFFFFFFWWWNWVWFRISTYRASALLLEPHLQSILLWLF